MYKHATYKEKYVVLDDWMSSIIEDVKKDIKNDHLKKDIFFIKKYLASKNISKLTTEDLVQAYKTALSQDENAEELAEFITSRWLLKNSELYDYFDKTLSCINPDFASIEELDLSRSNAIITEAGNQFGIIPTYLFSVLNSVVFSPEAYKQLAEKARIEKNTKKDEEELFKEKATIESLQKNFESERNRLVDKYEKKLAGLQKKYHTDIDHLKKQVAHLQRKLNEKSS